MARLYTNDLAAVLMEKHGIGRLEALRFLEAFVETIQEGVTRDRLVKIKSLGSFKVVDVDSRKSINVNTGESVVIDGHAKLTFTPETALKELINKPFSAFETVMLNDGVSFDEVENADMVSSQTPLDVEEVATLEEPVIEVPVVEEEPAVKEEPVVEEEPAVEEEPVVSTGVSSLLGEHESQLQEETQNPPPTPPIEETDEVVTEKSRWWLWLLIAVIACGLTFAGGYWAGHRQKQMPTTPEPAANHPVAVGTDSLSVNDTTAVTIPTDTTAAESSTVTAPPTTVETTQPTAEEDYLKYEAMDERVRRGAYNIIGTEEVIRAREGDTSRKIARRTIGDGMECYIEVYNGIDGSTVLKEGQEVKMPKLRVKKAARSKFRRK